MKKVYYCTHDDYGDGIEKNATIRKFYSFKDMEEFILKPYGEDRKVLVVEQGEWNSDGWICIRAMKSNIHVGNSHIYQPFNYRQLDINKGTGYVTPKPPIYVVKWKTFF